MGFSLLNNIAVAIEAMKKRHGPGRVAVIDWACTTATDATGPSTAMRGRTDAATPARAASIRLSLLAQNLLARILFQHSRDDMRAHSFRTSDVPRLERRRHWEASLSPYFGRLHRDTGGGDSLDAHLDVYDMGGIAAIRMEISRSRVTRLARDAIDKGGDYFKLSMQLRGCADVTVDGETVRLDAGDWIALDQRRPYTWESPADSKLFGLQIPRARLTGMKLPAMLSSQSTEPETGGMKSVLSGYLRTLEAQIGRIAEQAAILLADTSLGLVAAMLEDERRVPARAEDSLAGLRLRAEKFVRARACDPEFTVDELAKALHCSRRYLYKAFSGEMLSPEKMIWQLRLERSCQALLAPKNAARSIGSIAFDHGFNSDAHFIRAFKARYGMPPARYRQHFSAQP